MANDNTQEQFETRLTTWLNRKTIKSAVCQVGELPLSIGSDVGIVRGENQDRVAVMRVPINKNHYFIAVALCDGMGGMAEGSICASQSIATFFTACIRNRYLPVSERVSNASLEANKSVFSKYRGKGGATLSALMFDSINGMIGVNVGDSRIYAFKDNLLEQVSTDDTMAGLLQKSGSNSSHANELLQFIGMGEGMEPHILSIPTNQEYLVLTSDGVHFINKQTMQSLISFAKDPAVATKRLIEVAKWFGGHDNASAAVVNPNSIQARLFGEQDYIQIWDSFGELAVIIPKNENPDNTRVRPQIARLTDKQEYYSTTIKPSKPKSRRSTKKKKNTEKQTDIETYEKDKPQIEISFED